MSSDSSKSSFVNGILAGAGAVLAIMSVAFVQMVSPLEGLMGYTSTETRVAILLGGIVCAVAIGYEFYRKKEDKNQPRQLDKDQSQKEKTEQNKEKKV